MTFAKLWSELEPLGRNPGTAAPSVPLWAADARLPDPSVMPSSFISGTIGDN